MTKSLNCAADSAQKVRQDWSKWTLYNLSRQQTPPAHNKTFFQQKWLAKSLTRAYHGEQIREGKWTRMFDRRLPAVVPMDYRVLARTDGSDQAAGRGSGVAEPTHDEKGQRKRAPAKTPYMHMTYFPTERRLDTAVWRPLFASSARQARQFVVHGFVKVNGKKVRFRESLFLVSLLTSADATPRLPFESWRHVLSRA